MVVGEWRKIGMWIELHESGWQLHKLSPQLSACSLYVS